MQAWFMFDNHTFAKVDGETREILITRATELFRQDGCGCLFVRDRSGSEVNRLALYGRILQEKPVRFGVLPEDIEQWADSLLAERSFLTTL